MREKNWWIRVVISVSVVALLAGGVNASPKVTLNVVNMKGWTCTEPYLRRIGEFEKATGIDVRFLEIPNSDITSKQYAEIVGKSGSIDIYLGDLERLPVFEPGMQPLNKFIEQKYGSVEAWKEKFFSLIGTCIDEKGNVLYVPMHANVEFFVYRKNLFEDPEEQARFREEYGYDLAPPRTHQQIVDVAKFFTRDTDGDGRIDLWGFLTQGEYIHCLFWMFDIMTSMGVNGHDLLDSEGKVRIREGGPDWEAAVKAAQFTYDLIYKYKVAPPGTVAIGHSTMWEMWKKGYAAMSHSWWGDYWTTINIPELTKVTGPVGSFSLPSSPGVTEYGWGSWWAMGVSRECKYPEQAFEFLEWVTTRDIQHAMSEGSGQASPIKEFTLEEAENGWVTPALYESFMRASSAPDTPKCSVICEAIRTETHSLWADEQTPEEMVRNLAKRLEEILVEEK